MLHKTRGIILHTIKYSETSVICKIFTRDLGLQSYMVNGVRTAKPSSKAPLFRPINILDLVAYHKGKDGLQRLKEYNNGFIYRSLPFDIIKSSIALFMIEVLNKVITSDDPNPELYDFVEETFVDLDQAGATDNNFHLYFLLRMSRYLGFTPAGEYSEEYAFFDLREGSFTKDLLSEKQFLVMPPYSQYISALLEENDQVLLTNKERTEVLEYLLKYYTYHLQGFSGIQSHKILHEVLEG